MLRSSRLPHGARWHALRSSWRRQLPSFIKLLVGCSVVGYFFWNVSYIAQIMQSGAPALRIDGPRGVAEGLRGAFADVLAAKGVEEAWWLRPESYRKEVRPFYQKTTR